ncbi:MAG TPA: GGDEF domain-containing protein [Jiangellaceae bacterium]|jgi:diguanylate cyclase (GGDEF)-like protein|nr:GGDEF domain-containing protein [Jiangellaceae bacterium]
MSWHPFRLAAAYAVPVPLVIAAVTGWPAGSPTAVALMTTLLIACQVWLFQAHLRSAHAARLDPLTGLPGRAFLVDRMRRALASPAGVGLVFVDLDRFKAVNDTYGHVTGDLVLVETARRLRQLVPAGAVVARYGGDEFAVMVPVGSGEITDLAHRIQFSLPHPASVGTAQSRGGSIDDMLAAADREMYRAKRVTGIWTAVPNGETQRTRP